jgi:hypothetical protein
MDANKIMGAQKWSDEMKDKLVETYADDPEIAKVVLIIHDIQDINKLNAIGYFLMMDMENKMAAKKESEDPRYNIPMRGEPSDHIGTEMQKAATNQARAEKLRIAMNL